MEENCDYHRLELPDNEPLKELKRMLANTFRNKQVSMWGVPINMESSDTTEKAKADVILPNFLKAKNCKVQDAYNMLIKSLEWRKAYGADSIVEQDLGFKTLENRVCYYMGCDRQGRSICYTDYSHFYELVALRGIYELNSLYGETFNYGKREKFISWRIQVIERLIQMLSFKPGGINSIVLVQDNKHHSFNHRLSRDLLDVDNKISSIMRDNYPGMISYKIAINVPSRPWIERAVNSLINLFNGIKPMCKIVISDEASVPETLYKYISPEHIQHQFGGIYGTDDNLKTVPVSGIMVKGGETLTITIEGIRVIQISVLFFSLFFHPEAIVITRSFILAHEKVWWDVVAGGSYFEYSCRFVPDEEERSAKMVQNPVKEKRVCYYCYTAKEDGKIVISICSRVTKLISYRYKVQDLKV